MKKGILCTALMLVLLLACIVALPTEAHAATITNSGTCGTNLIWTLDDAGTLTISGTGQMMNFDCAEDYQPDWYTYSPWFDYSIQRVVIECGVTSVGDFAFQYCRSLISVIIPDSVTSIGEGAFLRCTNMTSVTIGNSVNSVGYYAFSDCDSLKNVYYKGYCIEWPEIQIGYENDPLLNATITYAKHNANIGFVTQEATKTATGEMTYTCSNCGDTYTESIPALFYGTNTDLGNTLNVNFYFYKGLVGTDGYVEIIRSFADGSTETTTKSLSEFGLNGDYYQITYPGLAAREMNDSVSITVFDKDGNQVSETKTDSISSYVRRALDKITDPTSRKMYVDMLNYGAAAQLNFGYDTENLANSILTESEKAEGTQTVGTLTNGYTRENESYCGTNFDLENEISLNLYVRAEAIGENGYAEISYTNHRGEEITKTVTEYAENGNCYMFTPDFVVAADGRCLLTIQFYKADGTPVVKVTDSMESYVARAIDADPVKYSWMAYMMIYSDSAREYLNK